jgi:hypothetical protein
MSKLKEVKQVKNYEDFDFTDPFSELGIKVKKNTTIVEDKANEKDEKQEDINWKEKVVVEQEQDFEESSEMEENFPEQMQETVKPKSRAVTRFAWFSLLFLLTSFLIYNLVEFKKDRDIDRDSQIFSLLKTNSSSVSSQAVASSSSQISVFSSSSALSQPVSSSSTSSLSNDFKYENKVFRATLTTNPSVVLSSLEAPFQVSFLSNFSTTLTSLIGIDNLTSQKVGVEVIPVEVSKSNPDEFEAGLVKALGDGYKKNLDFTNSKNISFKVYIPTKAGQNPSFYVAKNSKFNFMVRVWSISSTDLDQQILSTLEFK